MDQPNETIAALQAEIESLRRRNAELEQQVAELTQSKQQLQEVIENFPAAVTVKDLDRRVTLVNRMMEQIAQRSRDQIIGLREEEWFPMAATPVWTDHDRRVAETKQPSSAELVIPRDDGDEAYVLMYKFPLVGAEGNVYAIGTVATDISAQKKAERERLELQQQVIDAQQATLRELGTPLIPIADGVVAMPLVGTIDSARAQMIMETLLEGISEQQADVAILDITGVKVVDTQVASALLRAAQAAQLLGARIVLTGIGAEVAQSLVHLGADLSRIETRSNLQAGIAWALQSL